MKYNEKTYDNCKDSLFFKRKSFVGKKSEAKKKFWTNVDIKYCHSKKKEMLLYSFKLTIQLKVANKSTRPDIRRGFNIF